MRKKRDADRVGSVVLCTRPFDIKSRGVAVDLLKQLNRQPLTLILAGIRGLSARLDMLEERLEHLDRDVLKAIDAESEAATDTEREPPRIPTLALTNDGRTLLSLHYVEGADLSDRKTWTGIFLTEAEAFDAFDAMSDAADDAAAHVGGRIIARTRKKSEPEGESGDGSP